MKTKFQIIAFASIAVATLASCAKEQLKENVIPAGEKIQVSLNGQIGEFTPADATKATAESVVRVTWAANDKVFVYDGSAASIGTLTVTPDNNNASYAMLSGTITASSASPSKLTLVYVKGATEAPDIAGGKITVDLSSQDEAEVPFVLYTTVAYDAAALTKTNEYISFTFATSVMTVNCTGLQTGDSGAVADIDRAEIDGVSTACELTIDGTGVTAVAGTTPGTITRTETAEPSVFTQSDSRGSFRLALAADPTAPAARNILVHQGSKVSGSPFTSATLAAGKSYNTVYQMGEYVSIMLPGEFTVNASGKKVHFSKGNLWADATDSNNPVFHFEEHQYDYPVTNNSAHKSYFRWSIDAKNDFSNLSFDEFLDMVTEPYMEELLPLIQDEDFDALFEALNEIYKEGLFTNNPNFQVGNAPAGTYRTLTNDEWKYLFSENDIRRGRYKCGVTVCGKTNCVVLLPDNWNTDIISLDNFAIQSEYDGESNPTWEEMEGAGAVCLPAAGRIIDGNEEIFVINECGFYWTSSSFFTPDWFSARCVYFDSEEVIFDIEPDNCDIRNWQSIRLVTESASGYVPTEKVTGVSLNKSKTTIDLGDSEKLVATVAPANAANKQVTWKSSDEDVATVENGVVTGVAVGSAVITATTIDGNFTAVCLVTVERLSLPGEFSINSNQDKIHFAKGNLYCCRTSSTSSDWTWHFYDEQYQYNNSYTQTDTYGNLIAAASDTQIDLFTWGYDSEKSINPVGTDYVTGYATDGATFSKSEDWGYVFGGNSSHWRTLTKDEWDYLLGTSSVRNGKYRIDVTVCGKENCLVIAPDEWNLSANPLLEEYSTTSTMTWAQAEAAGLVCLPAVGRRIGNDGNELNNYGDICCYWSSSAKDGTNAWSLYSTDIAFTNDDERYSGYAVRLVSQ